MTRRKSTPFYRVNEQDRHRVELLISVGHSPQHIADVLGVSLATLREYFSDQLAHGRARTEAAVLERLFDSSVKERNGASIRAYAKMIAQAKAPSKPAKSAPERPGIDRALTAREQSEFSHWCHKETVWQGLIDDPMG
jgi:hypothetical protein